MNNAVKTLLIASALTLCFAATSSAQPVVVHGAGFGWSSHHGSSFGFSAAWGSRGYGHRGWGHRGRSHRVYAPIYAPMPVVHSHAFTVRSRRVWVDPVYNQQLTGYDFYGNPIYQTVCVRDGYWRNVRYNHCGCGHTIDCGY